MVKVIAPAQIPFTPPVFFVRSPGGVGDAIAVSASQLNLGDLGQNGGPTRTQEPGAGSVAIDAIDPADCEVDDDQRGLARPEGEGCDVGAVEVVR